jgi:hypothetical protein
LIKNPSAIDLLFRSIELRPNDLQGGAADDQTQVKKVGQMLIQMAR